MLAAAIILGFVYGLALLDVVCSGKIFIVNVIEGLFMLGVGLGFVGYFWWVKDWLF